MSTNTYAFFGRCVLGFSLILGLSTGVAAQDVETPDGSVNPILRLRTTVPELARLMTAYFGGDPAKVERPEGGQAQVLVLPDRSVVNNIFDFMQGRTTLEFGVQPHAFATIYEKEYKELQKQIRMVVGGMMALQGVDAAEANSLFETLFDLPSQCAVFHIRVQEGPIEIEKGLNVYISIVPIRDTPLYYWVRRINFSDNGAPDLWTDESMVSMRVSLADDATKGVLGPFVDAMVRLAPRRTRDQRAEDMDYYFRFLDFFDGTLAMTLDTDFNSKMVIGLRESKMYAESLTDENYLSWWKEQAEMQAQGDVVLTPEAMEHRSIKALKMDWEIEPGSNPLIPGGKVTGYRAVAGDFEVQVSGAAVSEEDMAKAMDLALDNKLDRSRLGHLEKSVVEIELDLQKVLGMIPPGLLPPEVAAALQIEDAPETLNILIKKTGITLSIHASLQ